MHSEVFTPHPLMPSKFESNKRVKIVPKALSGAIARHSGDGKFYAMPHNEALVGG